MDHKTTEKMNKIYWEGYEAYMQCVPEFNNPYAGLEGEYWSDGWVDAEEDGV